MRIYSMTATFGKLERETLELQPGLNILEAPNEWGKSTWCAFLTAMLYGVETRAHTTKTILADKERYAPWSGSPMSGRIELNWQGRDITIQRHTKGRIPMGEFSAFETKTGLPVPELTAQNCGQQLLGVEKAVFVRSAFLRGSDLPVEPEESLRRRLHALVTTGEENSAADDLERKLKELKNRCRANRTVGLLPQAYSRRDALERELRNADQLRRREKELQGQIAQLEAQQAQLELHRQTLDYQAAREAKKRYVLAFAEWEAAARQERLCLEAVNGLPDADILEEKLQQYFHVRQRLETLGKLLGDDPEAGLRQAREKARQDAQRCGRLSLWRWIALMIGLLAAAAGGLLWHLELAVYAWAAWVVGILCLGGAVLLQLGRRKLCSQYDLLPPRQWEEHAIEMHPSAKHWEAYQIVCGHLEKITGGVPAEAYAQQLQSQLDAWQRLREASVRKENAEQLVSALKSEDTVLRMPSGEDILTCSRQETDARLAQCRNQLLALRLEQARCRGEAEAMGQSAALERELEALKGRIAALEDTYAALEIALNALAEARTELQRRFAPQIVKKAQTLFSMLTQGRYTQLAMEEDLRLHIRGEGEDTLRSSLWRSEGTVDQLYLALRLAVASELVPHAPLILDDALVRFDDNRLKLALELLRQEAENRQILLFTCQSREKTACNL